MNTIQWLIISILSFNIGYYVGRWVGRSQEDGKSIRARLYGNREDRMQTEETGRYRETKRKYGLHRDEQ